MVRVSSARSAVHESDEGVSTHAVTDDPAGAESGAVHVTTTEDPICSNCASAGTARSPSGASAPAIPLPDSTAAPENGRTSIAIARNRGERATSRHYRLVVGATISSRPESTPRPVGSRAGAVTFLLRGANEAEDVLMHPADRARYGRCRPERSLIGGAGGHWPEEHPLASEEAHCGSPICQLRSNPQKAPFHPRITPRL